MCEFSASFRCYGDCYDTSSKGGFILLIHKSLGWSPQPAVQEIVLLWSHAELETGPCFSPSLWRCSQKSEWYFRSCIVTNTVAKLFGIAVSSLSKNKPFSQSPWHGPNTWRRRMGHVVSALCRGCLDVLGGQLHWALGWVECLRSEPTSSRWVRSRE